MFYLYEYKTNREISETNYRVLSKKIGLNSLFLPNEKFTFKTMLIRIYLCAISLFSLKVFFVQDEEKVIHTSFTMRGSFKYPFTKKGDLEIGPCETDYEYRGKGIYPDVLRTIIIQNPEKHLFMLVKQDNYSSIHGIEKAGFTRTAEIKKTILKQYKITKKLD